jgi:TolB-like protein/DNA-binding winged helix-turn-helix (wHTH) protein/tetratricopeptide (TPR) repeat protein
VASAPPTSRLVRFGVFEVDLEACELRKAGMRMKLGGQPFQVLQLLVEHPQQVVARDALKQHIWPQDTHVDYDLALKRVMNRLRDVLGDSAESPRFIETIPRVGYRFIAPVSMGLASLGAVDGEIPVVEHGVSEPAARRSNARLWQIFAAAVLVVGVLLGMNSSRLRQLLFARSGPPPNIHSLAVLPLTNLSPDPAQEYFSDGLTDALITELAQIGSFKVISRTSTMQYKKTTKPLTQIARDLNVDAVVEGTVQRSGDQVRVSLQLVDGISDQHIWAASYERSLKDVLTLERDLTAEVAAEIQARLTTETQAKLATPKPVNSQALEAYWQGQYYLHTFEQGSGDAGKEEAVAWFKQAIAADPNFAPAYVGLHNSYSRLSPAETDLAVMLATAEKAVDLDPRLAEARIALGDAKWDLGEWKEAEEQFRTGIALNPNDPGLHGSLANVLEVTGRLDEGLKEHEIAQSLDPANANLGWAFYRQRQYDRALDVLRTYYQSHREVAVCHWCLAQNYLQKRMTKDWVTEVGAYMASVGFPEVAGHLQQAAAAGGFRGALQRWAKELERLRDHKQFYWPGVIAQTYAMLGDKERAFYWLEDAYTHRRQSYNDPYLWGGLRIDPGFDSLRSDPRYPELLRRLGLPV